MPTIIRTDSRETYTAALAAVIEREIISNRKRITFLDCMNKIDQYMFPKDKVKRIMDSLFLGRMERFFDFYRQLRSIHFNSYFWKSDVLLISSYKRLMDDLNDEERVHYAAKVEETMQRIEEKYGKEVVVVDT